MQSNLGLGSIVKSICGRDADSLYVVVAVLNDSFVLVCNGKNRGLDKPKLKRIKHLKDTYKLIDDDIFNRLKNKTTVYDFEIATALKNFLN